MISNDTVVKPARPEPAPGVVPVVDCLLDAFSKIQRLRELSAKDRDTIDALITVLSQKLQQAPGGKNQPVKINPAAPIEPDATKRALIGRVYSVGDVRSMLGFFGDEMPVAARELWHLQNGSDSFLEFR